MGLIRKTRAGIKLSRDEVKAIKKGRKKLRKEMRARGIKDKDQFELTAASMGLYIDKNNLFLLWLWRHWLGALIGALAAFLGILFLFSMVQEMRGLYTISLSDDMLKDGFVLSDDIEFTHPTTHLFSEAAEAVPCVSISHIPNDVNDIDGPHNDVYFAHTFYIRNEGENIVDYEWDISINRETQDLSSAIWFLVFEDGNLHVVAKANTETGREEAIPPLDVNNKGYTHIPIMEIDPANEQFEVVAQQGSMTYWRVIPDTFVSEKEVINGSMTGVEPMEVHKYTVVMFLEGDDPEATDDRIGGIAGIDMDFRMITEEDEDDGIIEFWKKIFDGLDFL